MKQNILTICVFCTFLFPSCSQRQTVESDFAQVINSKVLQRLKEIDQSGPARYMDPYLPEFSRFEHSVGVGSILQRFNCSKEEQVAGLLHDSSHTVFSHLGDFVFAKKNLDEFASESFQDSIHNQYLIKNNCEEMLAPIGLTLKDVDIEKNNYRGLEQKLPDLCADRIEYNLTTGIKFGLITKTDAKNIINAIRFQDGIWFFADHKLARKFSELSCYFTLNFWGAKWNTVLNIHFANAINRAIQIGLINTEDLFSTDKKVLNILRSSTDQLIKINLLQCEKLLCKLQNKKYKKVLYHPKFRGVDPLVICNDKKLRRLTEIDIIYKNYYDFVKEFCKNGYYVDVLVS